MSDIRPSLPKQSPPSQHEVCEPVYHEGPDLLNPPPGYEELIEGVTAQVADQIEATHAGLPEDLTDGTAAQRVLREKCADCIARTACPVEKLLGKKVDDAQMYAKLAMFREAHPLLTITRLQRANMTKAELKALLTTDETIRTSLADGRFDPDTLLGGIKNKTIKTGLHHSDLPALAYMPGIKDDGPFEAHLISFGAFEEQAANPNNTFILVDCTQAHGFKGASADKDAYRILAGKLLGRMQAIDSKGSPHILSPDNIEQKVIHTIGRNRVDEIRMRNKERLYIAISPANSPNEPHTIILLGTHSGDETTQQEFIDTLGIH
jgi:hypothetical protein